MGGALLWKWKWARTFRSGNGFNSNSSENSSSGSSSLQIDWETKQITNSKRIIQRGKPIDGSFRWFEIVFQIDGDVKVEAPPLRDEKFSKASVKKVQRWSCGGRRKCYIHFRVHNRLKNIKTASFLDPGRRKKTNRVFGK